MTMSRLPARQSLRFALLASVSLLLSACSGTFDRLSDYPNVSTSSLPDNQSANVDSVKTGPVERASIQPDRPAWQNAGQRDATRTAGGTIVVQPGQTLYSIARANNVTPAELAAMNNLPPPYALKTGMSLRVPNANATAQTAAHQPQGMQATNAPAQNVAQAGAHTVKPGETLFSIGRAYNQNPYAIAEYNRLPQPYTLSAGQQLRIPGQSATQTALVPPAASQQQNAAQLPAQQQAKVEPIPQVAQAPAQQQAPAPQQQAAAEEQVATTFRWPVKGRVISTYGQKPNGMRNEGINISVPEGTSIRAAESGVVAYAGNELKGYGNLVLIRHDNGWVTAYAHGKELLVKRGDTVRRGDVIAKAGQTGSVTSPQLHFELRKGASAVDPMKYLGSDQAMN